AGVHHGDGCSHRAIEVEQIRPWASGPWPGALRASGARVRLACSSSLSASCARRRMLSDPRDPTPPRRIIVPGADPRREAPGARRGAPEGGPPDAPRIVLPPGVGNTEHDDLPEYPRLRPLEIVALRDGDRDLLMVSDPLGVMPAPVALRVEALEMLRVLDGS